MFAVLAIKVVPVLLVIDPDEAVTLIAAPLIAPLIKALDPKLTLPADDTVIVPKADVTVAPIATLAALFDVNPIAPPAVMFPLTVKVEFEFNVTVP